MSLERFQKDTASKLLGNACSQEARQEECAEPQATGGDLM